MPESQRILPCEDPPPLSRYTLAEPPDPASDVRKIVKIPLPDGSEAPFPSYKHMRNMDFFGLRPPPPRFFPVFSPVSREKEGSSAGGPSR
jgi:hypothetical protein